MLDYRWERAKRISGPSCKRLDAFGNYKVIKIKSGFSWGTLFYYHTFSNKTCICTLASCSVTRRYSIVSHVTRRTRGLSFTSRKGSWF